MVLDKAAAPVIEFPETDNVFRAKQTSVGRGSAKQKVQKVDT